MKTKVIFLDVDGVLNDWERSWRDVPDYNPEINPRCVKALNRIVIATEAKLVVSSTWRGLILNGHMDLFGFARLLRSHGVRGTLIGNTGEFLDERWQEIAAWIKEHKPGKYCIIDDDHDAFGGRPGVQTNGAVGLTDADADLAIEILGVEDLAKTGT